MDHSPYIENQLSNARHECASLTVERDNLMKMLIEAMTLIDNGGGVPSLELYTWWERRKLMRLSKTARAARMAAMSA